MPTLHLKISPPQTPQRHHQLAEALTRLTAHHLSKRAEVTAVMVEDLPVARWFVGGKVVAAATAYLEISVTQGTNTPAQKAAFIDAAFAELQIQLCGSDSSDDSPSLEPASYVIVRELPATDWGYSGKTQASRSAPRRDAG